MDFFSRIFTWRKLWVQKFIPTTPDLEVLKNDVYFTNIVNKKISSDSFII